MKEMEEVYICLNKMFWSSLSSARDLLLSKVATTSRSAQETDV